jgi:TRAP-type C4-dicarboxylate transport system substrate-binding protein
MGGIRKMIKSKLKISSIILFALVLIVSCIITVFATEKPITLTLAEYDTPIGLAGEGVKILQEEIAEKTNGRVELTIYWGGSLLKGKEILRGVADGVADMGHINPNYYPNQLPMNGVYAVIPQGPDKFVNQAWIFNTCMEQIPELKAEFIANNQIPIYLYGVLSKTITSTKPITCLADYKDKKIRASNRWALSMLEAAGAVPVSVPWSDCFMALQTGTIDAVYTNLDAIHRVKMDEIAPHIFACRSLWSGTQFIFTINLNTWNKLPEDIQGQIMDATKSSAIRYGEAYDKEWKKCIAEQKEMGCVVNVITPEDVEKWASMPVIEELQAKWVKESGDRGVKNAGELLKQIKEIVKQGIEREK